MLDTIIVSLQSRQSLLDTLNLIPPAFTYDNAYAAIQARPQAPVNPAGPASGPPGASSLNPGDPNADPNLALVAHHTPLDGAAAADMLLYSKPPDDPALQIGCSGYHGLCAAGQRWRARTAVNKKHYALGGYRSAVAAAKAS